MGNTFVELTSGLKFQEKMELIAEMTIADDLSQRTMHEAFSAELDKQDSPDREQFFEIIRKAADESSKVFVEIIRTNKRIKELLKDKFNGYIEGRAEGARMAAILYLILKYSTVFLYQYTDGRRDLEESEFEEIEQKLAEEIMQKFNISEKWRRELEYNIRPGLADPNNLARY